MGAIHPACPVSVVIGAPLEALISNVYFQTSEDFLVTQVMVITEKCKY